MTGDQQSGIRNQTNYENFKQSISDFKLWYDEGVRGLSDLDSIYEKNGNFMIGEGKWVPVGEVFEIPKGQTIMLLAFKKSLKNKKYIFICAQKRVSESAVHYYVQEIEAFLSLAREEQNHRGQTVLRLELSKFSGPMNTSQFGMFQRNIHLDFENIGGEKYQ